MAEEASKHGFLSEELLPAVEKIAAFSGLRLLGLMTVAFGNCSFGSSFNLSLSSCGLFSPNSCIPASDASNIIETGFVLLTAISVTFDASLPERSHASWMTMLYMFLNKLEGAYNINKGYAVFKRIERLQRSVV